MNDEQLNQEDARFDDLARTLRRLTPEALPMKLHESLAAAATGAAGAAQPSPLADRILAIWTVTGALAACFVAVFTLWQLAGGPRPAPATPQDVALHNQTAREIATLMASR